MQEQGENGIQWCDFSSNPLRYMDAAGRDVWACVKLSRGCAKCYAAALAELYGKGGPFSEHETAKLTPYVSASEVATINRSSKLAGKRLFMGDMTDVFGEWVPDATLDALFGGLAARHDYTLQVLTKRPLRLRDYMHAVGGTVERRDGSVYVPRWRTVVPAWPVPRWHFGTSVEDAGTAWRTLPLAQAPAAARFVSYEPALEEVDFRHVAVPLEVSGTQRAMVFDALTGLVRSASGANIVVLPALSQVIFGAESGPADARPVMADWAMRTVDDCAVTGVAAFVKQLGKRVGSVKPVRWPSGRTTRDGALETLRHRKGGAMDEWPFELRVRRHASDPQRPH